MSIFVNPGDTLAYLPYRWYTSLLGKHSSVTAVVELLKALKAGIIRIRRRMRSSLIKLSRSIIMGSPNSSRDRRDDGASFGHLERRDFQM